MTLSTPAYMFSRWCFLLAALVFLARLSWWIGVEHQFSSKLLMYAIAVGIFGTVGIVLIYGLAWVSDQEHKFKEQNKAATHVERRLSILESLQIQASKNQDALEMKYPKGYVLFGSEKQFIYYPLNKERKSEFTLDWENSKVMYIDDLFIVLLLKSFHYNPNEIQVEDLYIVLERKIGTIADGVYFNNVGMFVELIDDKPYGITYVIGFKSVKSIPNKRKLKPEVEKFAKKHRMTLMAAIDTNIQRYIKIKGLTISSGWTTIDN